MKKIFIRNEIKIFPNGATFLHTLDLERRCGGIATIVYFIYCRFPTILLKVFPLSDCIIWVYPDEILEASTLKIKN